MANQQSQINTIREYASNLSEGLLDVQGMIAKIDALGGAAFFQAYLEGGGEPDLTWQQFQDFYSTLSSMQTWIESNVGDITALAKR